MGFTGGSDSKEPACKAGDLALIPVLGGSPRGGNGNPLQCSCLRIPWTGEPGRLQLVHEVTKSQTRLSN